MSRAQGAADVRLLARPVGASSSVQRPVKPRARADGARLPLHREVAPQYKKGQLRASLNLTSGSGSENSLFSTSQPLKPNQLVHTSAHTTVSMASAASSLQADLHGTTLPYLHLMYLLKHLPRSGWLRFMDHPESVADHMYRMALIAMSAPVGLQIYLLACLSD